MYQSYREMRLSTNVRYFIIFSVLSCCFSQLVSAQGNLLITPRRVVFEEGKKTAELNVANTGKDTARYVISVMELRMKEDGSFETITEPDSGQNFASKYLRFFPRSVLLGPNEAQVVKVQLRNASQIPPGEYRSHVYFRAVPDKEPLGEAPAASQPGTISVQLTAVFGITIPVIIRVGPSNTQVSLSDVAVNVINDTLPRLSFSFNRAGNNSVYGDITVDHISPSGKTTRVCTAKGIAVYTPNTVRRVLLDLDRSSRINYHKGSIRVVYTSQADSKEKLAEKEIQLE